MLFNSYTFLIFLVCVLALHYAPFFSWRIKKFNLLWASYLFYAAWNPPFVLLLMFSTVVDWTLGRKLYEAKSKAKRRSLLIASLCVNLGMLSYFKYGGFILENFELLMSVMGVSYNAPDMNIILPVGISFYTFQTLSYTMDIYFKKMKPWNSFIDYAMYVTFFPQLVAGPIVRAADFLPQCVKERKASAQQFFWGVVLTILGMFQKIVLADSLFAPAADKVYQTSGLVGFTAGWVGSLAFTGQIFCDFAGYSTTAIGVAMMLGFALPDNFRFPYAAIGFSDFWRRWHISLSTWLRDYLYIPLGGNRSGKARTYVNLMLTMLIGGLWHGAAWTFVIWGGLHGLYLVTERGLKRLFGHISFWKKRLGQTLLGSATFVCVVLAWVFFRATSFNQGLNMASGMFGLNVVDRVIVDSDDIAKVLIAMGVIICAHIWLRASTLEDKLSSVPCWIMSLVLSFMLFAIYLNGGNDRAFIYFQF